MAEASASVDEKYQRYQAALTELIQFLDNGNMDAYFAQPTQGMQNALGEALGNYAQVSENLYRQTFDQSAHDYRFAQWQLGDSCHRAGADFDSGLVRYSSSPA
ncbi:methyl accepting chemotaxis protein II, aspartate sensor-receptor [Salmonella enterica subsp. arizonae]|uniref:Methyl accepting chemotaxis protein II, aspartate sensor-receptor n=1 Tax=Salmonella enterica subsp. arizonae TaxID=59203 RepID=A0A379S1A4_SALER|nr:methyl accepting chemotaxis protein II, aspartate sensor-receptor [Salmonella enterica subsp. arizonae]